MKDGCSQSPFSGSIHLNIPNEYSPSRLAADEVSNSFANKSFTAFAHYEVEINVPGGAVPPLTSLLRVDRALRAR